MRNNLILMSLAFLASLIAAELFFMIYTPFSAREWDYTEEMTNHSYFRGIPIEGYANSLGLRDKEYPLQHENYRILAIGDSFTYGFGLYSENSWPKQTELRLHKEGYDNIEILNGGRPGTDTQWQYDFFSNFTSRYEPDMVVIGFIVNDCVGLCSNCGAVNAMNNFTEAAANINETLSILRYFRLAQLKKEITRKTLEDYTLPFIENHETVVACQNAFLKFKKASTESNFTLIVIIYPMLISLAEEYPLQDPHDVMLDFFQNNSIEAYDITEAFYGEQESDLWISREDSHPNRHANAIAAERIAQIIEGHLGGPI